eukprot:gnl/MRDRNA2_/MRDRNA2_205194_c0_seq1.p1 gnl/MRDRNA2_/MRDRNA2_205194_c0~~gnl/MRDRNA2_/MRDRNA2_205194_c0_seq1.p1  ORF type:complete len:229 (+),score=31.96 gnl/MRDRNA2_/MRDRNA2_205194_c0_seq1:153-839(+)
MDADGVTMKTDSDDESVSKEYFYNDTGKSMEVWIQDPEKSEVLLVDETARLRKPRGKRTVCAKYVWPENGMACKELVDLPEGKIHLSDIIGEVTHGPPRGIEAENEDEGGESIHPKMLEELKVSRSAPSRTRKEILEKLMDPKQASFYTGSTMDEVDLSPQPSNDTYVHYSGIPYYNEDIDPDLADVMQRHVHVRCFMACLLSIALFMIGWFGIKKAPRLQKHIEPRI